MNEFITLSEALKFTKDKEIIFKDKFGIKRKGIWKADSLIETQERICKKHGLYTDEKYYFPTGHISWVGCRKCKEEVQQKEIKMRLHADMAARGMIWDNEIRGFVDKNEKQKDEEQPKVTRYSKYRG